MHLMLTETHKRCDKRFHTVKEHGAAFCIYLLQ